MTQQEKLNAQLFQAVINEDTDAIKKAIEDGADVNARDMYERVPLHCASHGNTQTVELLIEKGADVNAKDKYGKAPLYYAARWGHAKTIALLKQHGGV